MISYTSIKRQDTQEENAKNIILGDVLNESYKTLDYLEKNLFARRLQKNKLIKIQNNLNYYSSNSKDISKYSIPYLLNKLIPYRDVIDIKWTIIYEILNETDLIKSNYNYNILLLSNNYMGELDCLKYYCSLKNSRVSFLTSSDFNGSEVKLNNINNIFDISQSYTKLNHEIDLDLDPDTDTNGGISVNNFFHSKSNGIIINTNNYKNTYNIFKQLFLILYSLKDGDSMLFKLPLLLNNKSIMNLIYIAYHHFKDLIFYKPIQERNTRDFYIIGINYKQIDDELLDTIIHHINEINNNNLDFNDLDMFNDIYPEAFGIQLESINTILTNKYIKFQEKQIYYHDCYEFINKNISMLSRQYIMEKNIEWIKRYKFKKTDR